MVSSSSYRYLSGAWLHLLRKAVWVGTGVPDKFETINVFMKINETLRTVLDTPIQFKVPTLSKHESQLILTRLHRVLYGTSPAGDFLLQNFNDVTESVESVTCEAVILAERFSFSPAYAVLEQVSMLCEIRQVPYVVVKSFEQLLDSSIIAIALRRSENRNSEIDHLTREIRYLYVPSPLPFLFPPSHNITHCSSNIPLKINFLTCEKQSQILLKKLNRHTRHQNRRHRRKLQPLTSNASNNSNVNIKNNK